MNMTAKELVSKHLKLIGVASKRSDLGLNFTFEGWNFLLWNDKDEPRFFRLTLPCIFDVTDENFAKAIMACNNVNWRFKVVKAVLYDYEDGKEKGASVWLCYEQQLENKPDMDEIFPRAVQGLLSACDAFLKEMNDE